MTTRRRTPSDEIGTAVFEPARPTRFVAPDDAAAAAPAAPHLVPGGSDPATPLPDDLGAPTDPEAVAQPHDLFELDATEVNPRQGAPVERATPTHVDPRRPVEQATPTEVTARPERSEPIRVISMKDHAGIHKPAAEDRPPLHVQLRSMAEVARRRDTPVGLGRLAPPRDPRQARARRFRANAVWALVAAVLAGAISVTIWWIAGR